MAVHQEMYILTSNSIWYLVLPTSGLTDNLWVCILSNMFCRCIGNIAVDLLVSAFLLSTR
jgi:hypothetical protein